MFPAPQRWLLLPCLALLTSACGRAATPEPPTEPTASPSTDVPLCEAIEAAPYQPLPRRIAGNQFDPSGMVVVGKYGWLVNDREGRKGVPEHGNGIVRLDPGTGEATHMAVPGFDDRSRKFEGLAWDGSELHAIGNVGNRRDNTFLVSIALDPVTGAFQGEARYHDLATPLGAATGLGDEPWGHGIKIEALAATGPGELLIGLRRTGDGRAARFYRAVVPAPGDPAPLRLEAVQELQSLELGTATHDRTPRWSMAREVAGLSEPVCDADAVIGVASAEYEEGDDVWEFLSNGLFVWWQEAGHAAVLCTFDPGFKVEGVHVQPRPEAPGQGTLWLLYDNDSAAAGGWKRVAGVSRPCSPP